MLHCQKHNVSRCKSNDRNETFLRKKKEKKQREINFFIVYDERKSLSLQKCSPRLSRNFSTNFHSTREVRSRKQSLFRSKFLAGGTLSADAISASKRDGRPAKKATLEVAINPRSSHPYKGSQLGQSHPKVSREYLQRMPALPASVFESLEISTRIARLSCVPQPRVKNSINESCQSSIERYKNTRSKR